MTDDPMLAKAAVLEEELLARADANARYFATEGDLESRYSFCNTMRRAALLIQQMRMRLESLQRDGVD